MKLTVDESGTVCLEDVFDGVVVRHGEVAILFACRDYGVEFAVSGPDQKTRFFSMQPDGLVETT